MAQISSPLFSTQALLLLERYCCLYPMPMLRSPHKALALANTSSTFISCGLQAWRIMSSKLALQSSRDCTHKNSMVHDVNYFMQITSQQQTRNQVFPHTLKTIIESKDYNYFYEIFGLEKKDHEDRVWTQVAYFQRRMRGFG